MACPSSGQIKIQDIVDEFGGSTPHSLSEYYRDGGEVPSNNTNVPTSGTISLSNFYDAVNEIIVTVSSGTTNYSCSTAFGSHWTSAVPKRLIINSGVTIGGTGSNPALTIEGSMAGTFIVQNGGTITGYGGAAQGGTGGSAVKVLTDNSSGITFNNTGSLQAGGGGGGTGGDSGAGGTGGNGGAGGAGGEGGNGNYTQNLGGFSVHNLSCNDLGYNHCHYITCSTARCVQIHGSGAYCTSGQSHQNNTYCQSDEIWCHNCARHSTQSGASGGSGGGGGSGSGGGAATEGAAGGVGAGYQVSATNGQAGSASEGVSGSGGSSGSAGGNNGNGSGSGGTGGSGGEGGDGGDSGTSGEGGNGGGLGQAGQAGDNGQNGQAGENGATGSSGSSGANGNASNGAGGSSGQAGQSGGSGGSGQAGSSGGQAGYYIENLAYLTLSNSGTVQGRS